MDFDDSSPLPGLQYNLDLCQLTLFMRLAENVSTHAAWRRGKHRVRPLREEVYRRTFDIVKGRLIHGDFISSVKVA